MWEVIYREGRGGREIARDSTGDPPAMGDEIYIEQTSGVVEGGLFEVVNVRRVLSETGTPASVQNALGGGPIDVVPRHVFVDLKRRKE